MSHVDEGALHAWLDGALLHEEPERAERVRLHLEGCADCRGRLAEASRVRDRASEILARAAPTATDMPSFEEVRAEWRARAGAGGTGGREAGEKPRGRPAGAAAGREAGRGWRGPALAWAASVVLAVGAGWMARAQLGTPPADAGPEAVAVAADRMPEAPASRPAARQGAAEMEEAVPADDGRSRASGHSGRPEAEAGGRADGAGAAEEAERREMAKAAPARNAAAEADAAEPDAVRDREADRVAAAPPVAALEAEAAAFRDEGVPRGAAWIVVSPEDAGRWIGGRLLVVAGLPVEEVAISTRDGIPVARTVQPLDGARLTLVQAPREAGTAGEAGGAPDVGPAGARAAREDPSAASRLEVQRGGWWVVAEAPVAPDSLRVLVSRLR